MITISAGKKRGRRSSGRRVYVKMYEMWGDARTSVHSTGFTVYGITCDKLEAIFRKAAEQAASETRGAA
jgi:hypothetical protein